MLTIPPASDKTQQPLSCRVRCCTFWFRENIQKMLCSLNYPLMQASVRPAWLHAVQIFHCHLTLPFITKPTNAIMESLSLYFHVFSTFNGNYTSVATSDGRCGAVTLSLPLNTDVLLEMHMARNVRDEKKISFIHLSLHL